MNKKLIIIGSGGHSHSIIDLATSLGYEISSIISTDDLGNYKGIKVINSFEEIINKYDYCYVIAIGDNFLRQQIFDNINKYYKNLSFPTLIHHTAVVSPYAIISDGCILLAHSNLGHGSKLGKFCIINNLSSLDHDCKMSDFSSLAPGVITGGCVDIGMRSAVCIGSKVKHDITIGKDCILGGNSYLNINLPDNIVAYGSPAKIIRLRKKYEKYL